MAFSHTPVTQTISVANLEEAVPSQLRGLAPDILVPERLAKLAQNMAPSSLAAPWETEAMPVHSGGLLDGRFSAIFPFLILNSHSFSV